MGERARLIRGGDHGRTGAAVAWSRSRGGEGDAGSWARTVSGVRGGLLGRAGLGLLGWGFPFGLVWVSRFGFLVFLFWVWAGFLFYYFFCFFSYSN